MPRPPSTVIVMPSRRTCVPTCVPTTAGRPNSRATIAQWPRMPPEAATHSQAKLTQRGDAHLVNPEAVVLDDACVVFGGLHQFVESPSFVRIGGKLHARCAGQLLSTLRSPLEREHRIVLLIEPKVAL